MPQYNLVMICRVGESQSLGSLLKTVSTSILQEGGVVRGFTNLGDRVLPKTLKSQDGVSYGIGRYIQVEYYGSPQTRKIAESIGR
jgi:ribosomal protein S6